MQCFNCMMTQKNVYATLSHNAEIWKIFLKRDWEMDYFLNSNFDPTPGVPVSSILDGRELTNSYRLWLEERYRWDNYPISYVARFKRVFTLIEKFFTTKYPITLKKGNSELEIDQLLDNIGGITLNEV